MKNFILSLSLASLLLLIGCAVTSSNTAQSLPRAMSLSIGGQMGSSFKVFLCDDSLIYRYYESGWERPRKTIKIHPSEKQWQRFWSELSQVEIWKWHRHYAPPKGEYIEDGTQWDILIVYNDNVILSDGDNTYPGNILGQFVLSEPSSRFDRFTSAVSELVGHPFK